MNMAKLPKVLVRNSGISSGGINLLADRCELIQCPPKSTLNDVVEALKNAGGVDALLWSGHQGPTVDVLNAAGSNLKIIASISAGVDHFDINLIKSRGVLISNTPGVLNSAVAEIAVMLCLAASRRLEEGRRTIVENQWSGGFQWMLGHDLAGSTVGIVGLGGIGVAIAKRLKAFEIGRLLYTGHNKKPEGEALNAEFVSLDVLLAESDFVVAVTPLTAETTNMFNDATFGKMKNTAVFVNVGRGGIVDQIALEKALRNKTIFAAGLDVMTPEPLPYNHALTTLPNCVLIPHLGSATVKTRNAMTVLAAQNILAVIDGKPLLTSV